MITANGGTFTTKDGGREGCACPLGVLFEQIKCSKEEKKKEGNMGKTIPSGSIPKKHLQPCRRSEYKTTRFFFYKKLFYKKLILGSAKC